MFSGVVNFVILLVGDLVMQVNLNFLMYDGFVDYDGVKWVFQEDLGEEFMGMLIVWQIYLFGYCVLCVNMISVSFFLFDFGGMMIENWVFVKGIVEIIEEKIVYLINYVDIECSCNEGMCEYC